MTLAKTDREARQELLCRRFGIPRTVSEHIKSANMLQ